MVLNSRWLALLLVSAAGCDSGTESGEDAGANGQGDPAGSSAGAGAGAGTGAADAGGIDPTQLVGDFELKITPEMVMPMPPMMRQAAHASFLGKLFDKPKFPVNVFEVTDTAGDCELLVPNNPFCDPRCRNSVCTEDGCQPDAVAQSVAGDVRVLGLGDEELTLSPVGSSPSYQPATLPYPPCAEGDPVRVEADAFTLETPCVAPFEAPEEPVRVRSGEGTMLSWTPPADGALTRVEVELDISHHGGQKGEIDCDVPDTGSFEIPETLVTQLVALGVAGFATITLTRVSRAAADAAPNVTLSVSSHALRPVDTGIVSCSTDDDCPDAMTCDLTRLVCE